MTTIGIINNGVLDSTAGLVNLLGQADLIIAADGGANHCQRLNITPDILVGDLDSIESAVLATYKADGLEIHRYPRRKNATDLELALDLAIDKGAGRVYLVGALGGRWDMSLANIFLAASKKYKDASIRLVDKNYSMRILHPGKSHKINGVPGDRVSLLPLQGDVYGVTLTGFVYPLTNHIIRFGSSLGISNVLRQRQVRVQLSRGILLYLGDQCA